MCRSTTSLKLLTGTPWRQLDTCREDAETKERRLNSWKVEGWTGVDVFILTPIHPFQEEWFVKLVHAGHKKRLNDQGLPISVWWGWVLPEKITFIMTIMTIMTLLNDWYMVVEYSWNICVQQALRIVSRPINWTCPTLQKLQTKRWGACRLRVVEEQHFHRTPKKSWYWLRTLQFPWIYQKYPNMYYIIKNHNCIHIFKLILFITILSSSNSIQHLFTVESCYASKSQSLIPFSQYLTQPCSAQESHTLLPLYLFQSSTHETNWDNIILLQAHSSRAHTHMHGVVYGWFQGHVELVQVPCPCLSQQNVQKKT